MSLSSLGTTQIGAPMGTWLLFSFLSGKLPGKAETRCVLDFCEDLWINNLCQCQATFGQPLRMSSTESCYQEALWKGQCEGGHCWLTCKVRDVSRAFLIASLSSCRDAFSEVRAQGREPGGVQYQSGLLRWKCSAGSSCCCWGRERSGSHQPGGGR